MTSWTNPRTWNIGELVTKAMMDTHIRDNFNYIKEQLDLIGVAVLKLTKRQGGSSTDWNTAGTTNFTPTAENIKIQTGVTTFTVVSSVNTMANSITFPIAFTNKPMMLIGLQTDSELSTPGASAPVCGAESISTSGCNIRIKSEYGMYIGTVITVAWLAIGE